MHATISAFVFSFLWKMGDLSLKRDNVTRLYLPCVDGAPQILLVFTVV